MKRSYLDYAMSVIVGRALPDVRDGLKPVHRRVLYGMWEAGNLSNRAYKKSARIVGDVMGKYHPHGDSAIYDTLVRMAQEFSLRYPLVDGQGNFGSIDGDMPAAMRYTEVRLTKLAEEMLRDDIDKETVPWIPNYDGSEREPNPLPAKVPNLLINGSSGIAVGMATNIPPHNLTEVIAALELYMDDPSVPLEKLMAALPGPDFPTGGTIHGRAGIRSAYATGRGTIQVRARAEFEEHKDRQAIIITEIPYQVNKVRLIERIVELVREKTIEGITDLRDESDRDGIRVVVELRRGEIAEVILNSLYKLTPMQISFGINMLAIVDNQPQTLGLKDLLRHFLEHRKTVVVRRTRFDLRKAEERAHILEGILKALDHLDEVITCIRTSRTPPEAKERLAGRVRALRGPGAGHPRDAAAAPDRARARQGGRGVHRGERHHREAARDPPVRRAGAGRDPPRARRAARGLRRRAPHRDHRRHRRHHGRGHDRRRGHGDHGHQHRLRQALAGVGLPRAAARRQGPHGDVDQGGRLRRAPLHRVGAQLHPGLHRARPGALAQGAPDPRARAGGARQGDRQPAPARARGEGGDHGRGPLVRRRSLPLLRHRAGHGQEDRAPGVRQPAGARHHRDRHRARATACSTSASPTASATSCSPPARASPSGSPRPTCGRWAAPPTACAASDSRAAIRWWAWRRSRAAATSSPSPRAATASGRRSTSIASRAAAARASSTSRCRPRPAR